MLFIHGLDNFQTLRKQSICTIFDILTSLFLLGGGRESPLFELVVKDNNIFFTGFKFIVTAINKTYRICNKTAIKRFNRIKRRTNKILQKKLCSHSYFKHWTIKQTSSGILIVEFKLPGAKANNSFVQHNSAKNVSHKLTFHKFHKLYKLPANN